MRSGGSPGSSPPGARRRECDSVGSRRDRTGSPSWSGATTWSASSSDLTEAPNPTSRTRESRFPPDEGAPRHERTRLPLGDAARPTERVLPDGRLESAVPPRPRRRPVPGPDRHDPLPADARRGDRRSQRRAVRALSRPRVAGAGPGARGRAADPRHRVLPHQGAGPGPGGGGDPGPLPRGRPPDLRGADLPTGRGSEDGELRPRVRVRDPGDPGRYPRPPDREPPRGGPDPHAGADGASAQGGGRPPLLDPGQPAPRSARPEPVPTDPPPMPGVPDLGDLRYGPGPAVRAGPPSTGGPPDGSSVAGSATSTTRNATIATARNVQATG
jgi:hypothetical protein